jgi:coenzyme PQQ precursor peptide PqqA
MDAGAEPRILTCVPADALKVQAPHFRGFKMHWSKRMKWEKPAASDMRFGFEITMYIANR